jgi:hypothetical protein
MADGRGRGVSFASAAPRAVKSRRAVFMRPTYALEDRIEELPEISVRSRPHSAISADQVGLVINTECQDGAP